MVETLIQTLSKRRFETYLRAAGHEQERAFELYLWNAELGASFHILVQAVEVALRNRVNVVLVMQFDADWWQEDQFLRVADHDRDRDLQTVMTRLRNKRKTIETDQIVASLSFGFWVGMLQKRYNPGIWSRHLRVAFPLLPETENRHSVFDLAGRVAGLRNRISHHEPLIKLDAMHLYGDMMKLLSWICPDTAEWIRQNCEVPAVVRRKPKHAR